jgi:hypothetical protein
MNLTCILMVVLLAAPLAADDGKITTEAIDAAATNEDPPAEKGKEPTVEELAGKLKSLGEKVNDGRNVLEKLGPLKINGYVLAQYVNDQSSKNELSGEDTRNKDQFSIREARLKFTYQLNPTSRFVVQPDFSGSGVSLKDGFLELSEPWTKWHHTLTAGQFNWPFGFEIAYSSTVRELPERSRVIRTLFPGERDRGVQFSGTGPAGKFRYEAAIVNGTGTQESFDFNKRKDFVGHVRYSLGPIDLGASLYRGADLVATSTNPDGVEFTKDRTGADIQWTTPIHGLGLRAEYVHGTQPPGAGTTLTRSSDVDGWYLYAVQSIGTRHQFAARLDEYDPDTRATGDATRTLGASYTLQWDANSKVMLAYERPKTQGSDPKDNIFTVRYAFIF